MKNRLLYAFAAMFVVALICGCEEQKVVDVPAPQPVVKPFTFTAVAGVDTRVDAAFGSNENTINFTWSEGDCISVCFIKPEELAAFDENYHGFEGETYTFSLKSGAGTSKAVFQSVDMNPSEVLEPGVEYIMNAVYNPAFNGDKMWGIWDNHVECYRSVEADQIYDVDAPLANLASMDMLGAYPVSVYQDSTPELQFEHGIAVYRIRIHNTGLDPLSVASVEHPSTRETYGFYAPVDAGTEAGGSFGESWGDEVHGLLTMKSPLVIDPDETISLYIPIIACQVYDDGGVPRTHIVTLSNGKTITVIKNPPAGFKLCAGHMYTTTLSIRSEMATDESGIPPITGGTEDDF